MKLIITSDEPNPIITPDEIRNMVLAMAETNLNIPDYVSEVWLHDHSFCLVSAMIYARQFRIPVKLIPDTDLSEFKPDAVLCIGESSEVAESSCKANGIAYSAFQIPEVVQIGIIAHVDNGDKMMITADKAEQILLTDTPA